MKLIGKSCALWNATSKTHENETQGSIYGVNLFVFCLNNALTDCDYLGWMSGGGWFGGAIYSLLNNRAADFVNCIADCIKDNYPMEDTVAKLLMYLSTATIPKSLAVKIVSAAGKDNLAELVVKGQKMKGVKSITTVPNMVARAVVTNQEAKNFLRLFGVAMSPFWTAYGLYMAQVEVACVGACATCHDYNEDKGIKPLLDADLLYAALILIFLPSSFSPHMPTWPSPSAPILYPHPIAPSSGY